MSVLSPDDSLVFKLELLEQQKHRYWRRNSVLVGETNWVSQQILFSNSSNQLPFSSEPTVHWIEDLQELGQCQLQKSRKTCAPNKPVLIKRVKRKQLFIMGVFMFIRVYCSTGVSRMANLVVTPHAWPKWASWVWPISKWNKLGHLQNDRLH